jgi:signal transduction histidine kinase
MRRVEAPAVSPQPLAERVAQEQLKAHYELIPAMVAAPLLGALFTCAVLWQAVDRRVLVIGFALLAVLSAVRLVMVWRYRRAGEALRAAPRWKRLAVGASFASGCLWGSAAVFLYPPAAPEVGTYVLVLLVLVPVIPVAALATWLPAFHAYFVPCTTPFLLRLLASGDALQALTAVLLVMMMGAMWTFASRYAKSLATAIELRLRLDEKGAALEEALREKGRLIAAASHDLRQPVHAIGLFLDTLGHARSALPAGEALRSIESSQRALQHMLDDMLDLSRLDAGVLDTAPRAVRARELLEPLAVETALLARGQGLRFRLRVQDTVLHGDPALLERMLRNLLSNALKFTEAGGIALVCRARGGHARLQVIDTGPGIEAADAVHVFGEWQRGPAKAALGVQGLGLGLAIVQGLAARLGHRVTLRSRRGHGSTFTIHVPHVTQVPHVTPVPHRRRGPTRRPRRPPPRGWARPARRAPPRHGRARWSARCPAYRRSRGS